MTEPRFPEDYGRVARWREMQDLPLDELDARYARGSPQPTTGAGDLSYVHVQSVPSSKWRMPHGMGRKPGGTFFDTADSQWHPDIHHESTDVTIADFGEQEIAGTAYLD